MAETLGESDLDAVRGRLRQQIEGEYGQLTRARLKRGVLDQLAENHDFLVPPGMVEVEFEAIWKQIEEDRKHGHSDPEDTGKSDDDLKDEYRGIAERRVRLGLLLSEVGRLNEIEVSPDEVNQALMQEARRYPGQERQVFEHFQKSPEAMANLRAPIFEDKVIDFITDLAEVSERSVSPEQLRDELAAEQKEADGGDDESADAPKEPAENAPAAAKTEAAQS